MVKLKQKFDYLPDGSPDLHAWLEKMQDKYALSSTSSLLNALTIAESSSKGLTTFYGQPCLEQGMEMAEIILDLKLDLDCVCAAILTSALQHTNLKVETIADKIGENVSKLLLGVHQMNILNSFAKTTNAKNQLQTDRLRKTFLAMASDIRIILITLAERTCIMRGIKNINSIERKRLAEETRDIYAPLANRLGIGQLKWELEDLAFHYIDPLTYKKIASFLAEKRLEREQRIADIIHLLKEKLKESHIKADITGRAKHIYSIYLKMQRKGLDLKEIHDYSAVRILVPDIHDCYTALGIVHHTWEHIPEEFDDYITKPKPNGYRSIHTAVIDPLGKNFEIQIRTHQMHDEAEHGVAAHWVYKEKKQEAGYEEKIALLRQLLAWHKDLVKTESAPNQAQEILDDRVYVFTPAGEIMDLPSGSTPLDFAYHIHSGLGHRCRGAKIHGHIVPLTYQLKTGDNVEIITVQNGTPSRDWLNKENGYLKTARARAKVSQWFKHQDTREYIESGKHILEREFSRNEMQQLHLNKIAESLKFKDEDSLLAALGRGTIRLANILHFKEQKPHTTSIPIHTKKTSEKKGGFQIGDARDLMSRIAKCCKPIPGDDVIGFITQGRGVSIHKKDCNNISHIPPDNENRLIPVNWDQKNPGAYYVDLQVHTMESRNVIKEVTSLLSAAKIDLIALNSTMNKSSHELYIVMTILIHDVDELTKLITQIKNMPHVINVTRITE